MKTIKDLMKRNNRSPVSSWLGGNVASKILLSKFIGLLFILVSCSEEGFDPCNASVDAVKMHYRNMQMATDPVEKEKHRQMYLTEKHFLEYCRSIN